jgi:hypothetical protein
MNRVNSTPNAFTKIYSAKPGLFFSGLDMVVSRHYSAGASDVLYSVAPLRAAASSRVGNKLARYRNG